MNTRFHSEADQDHSRPLSDNLATFFLGGDTDIGQKNVYYHKWSLCIMCIPIAPWKFNIALPENMVRYPHVLLHYY